MILLLTVIALTVECTSPYAEAVFLSQSGVDAGIAQLVEHNLAKVGVASSNLVSRSKLGGLAEWLCSGLQIRVPRFDSGTRLHKSHVFLKHDAIYDNAIYNVPGW